MQVLSCSNVVPALLDGARTVYQAAFGEYPYREPPSSAEAFVERVRRYASTRDGFRLVLAQDDRGTVTGLVLSVVAHPGDWWREQVAARLGREQSSRWLGPACVEIVHVAVHPRRQGQGIGAAMLETVRAQALAPRAVLSVHSAADRAQRLYLRSGWSPIVHDLQFPGAAPAWLMGRPLP